MRSFLPTIILSLACLANPLHAAEQWRGKWIWDSGDEKPLNYYLYLRKTFDLPAKPSEAPVRVCADSRYKLFVNGRYVGRGPVRSDPRWQYYDTYDLAPYLTSGRNVIAALVHHYGTGTFAYILGRGAFLFDGQVSCGSRTIELASDPSWRVMPGKAWFRDLPRMDVQLEFNEVYDANQAPDGWTEIGFDDLAWESAKVIGPVGMDPWPSLVPREIPEMYEREVFPVAVYEIGTGDPSGVVLPEDNKAPIALIMGREKKEKARDPSLLVLNSGALLRHPTVEDILQVRPLNPRGKPESDAQDQRAQSRGREGCTVKEILMGRESGKATYLVLDFGREIAGYPRIVFAESKSGTVDIGYAELLTDGKVDPNHAGVNYADRYVMKPGRQAWETFDKRAFRYMQLDFRYCPGPVVIESVSVNFSTYPVEWRGQFECSDQRLNDIWRIGAYTVQLNMEDAYTDCPWRERAQWWGDARVQAMTNYYAFADPHLVRQGIRQIGQSQKDDGITACFWPGTYDNPIPAFSLYWIMSVRDYHSFTGDEALVREMFPRVKKLIGWFESHKDQYGLLTDLPHWNFIDWTNTDIRGTITAHNCLYYRALEDASAMALIAGDAASSRQYRQRADELKEVINSRLFDTARGMYPEYYSEKDKAFSNAVSQMPNGLACAYGIAPPEKRTAILRSSLDGSRGIIPAGSFFAYYFLEGLFENGMHVEALDYMRHNYGKMLDAGATTLWEHWGSGNSLCHGWASAPTSHLPRYILGVEPIKPGFARASIFPNAGDLDWARGIVPAPHGDIAVDWKKADVSFKLTVSIPSGVTADVGLPILGESMPTVLVNGSKRLPDGVKPGSPDGGRQVYEVTKAGKYEFVLGP